MGCRWSLPGAQLHCGLQGKSISGFYRADYGTVQEGTKGENIENFMLSGQEDTGESKEGKRNNNMARLSMASVYMHICIHIYFPHSRPPPFSARERSRIRLLVLFLFMCLGLCWIVWSAIYRCLYVVYTGVCVHVPTGKCMLSLAASQACGHGAVATSPLLGYWIWPPPVDNF